MHPVVALHAAQQRFGSAAASVKGEPAMSPPGRSLPYCGPVGAADPVFAQKYSPPPPSVEDWVAVAPSATFTPAAFSTCTSPMLRTSFPSGLMKRM